MARDAIARLYDVDAKSVMLTPLAKDLPKDGYPPGQIVFDAKKGNSINLDKMAESIAATRLSGGTNMGMDYLEITARGEVSARDKDLVLKVSDTGQEFVLADDPSAKDAVQRLRQALGGSPKEATVTGRVRGWNGRFPDVLRAWSKPAADQKRTLALTSFEIKKE
ncbi:hypothetical protein AYO44_14985 [Planctomycetaceae bacterium SCGC AG-212-F19]|nr:hypothetical protein AYO44_14985 [Planctomycetaceae bacterium SCGC AG-212-F19]